MQASLISKAHPCWSAGFRLLCISQLHFLITYCRVCKQDTLSHHFIQRSCKYFGGSHQLLFGQKTFGQCNHSNCWVVSTSKARMSKSSVSWDSWVINTYWNPLACSAITHRRANLSLFSLRLLHMSHGSAYIHIHAALPGICNVSPFQE